LMSYGTYGGSAMFWGGIYGAPIDTSSITAGAFYGPWQWWGVKAANPNSGENACMFMAGGDSTKNGGANFGFASNCQQTTRFRLTYNFASDVWQWQLFNNYAFEYYAGPTYTGYVGDSAGYFNYVYYPNGLMLNGEPGTAG